MSMLSQLAAATKFLTATSAALGADHSQAGVVKDNQYNHLLDMWTRASPTLDDATSCLVALTTSSPFNDEQTKKLCDILVAGPTRAHAAHRAATTKAQTHLFLYNYLSNDDWIILRGDASVYTKVDTVVNRCLLFGLAHPTEQTMVAAVALVMTAGNSAFDAAVGFSTLAEFKAVFKRRRLICNVKPTVAIFLENAAEHWKSHPDVSDVPPPVPSPISVLLINDLRLRLPARKSNRHIRDDKAITIKSQSPNDSAMFATMSNMFMNMMTRNMPQDRCQDRIDFITPKKTVQLAICNDAAEKEHCDADEARAPASDLDGMVQDIQAALAKKKQRSKDVFETPPKQAAAEEVQPVSKTIKQQPAKVEAKAKTNATAKAKAKAKANAKATTNRIAQQSPKKRVMQAPPMAKNKEIAPRMPCLTGSPRIDYKNCRIYTSVAAQAWRVMPIPGAMYDKSFTFGSNPKATWANVIAYCKKPIVPADHC